MSSDFRLRLAAPFHNMEVGPGHFMWEFLDNIRHVLLDTVHGEMILENIASFVSEVGDLPSVSLRYDVEDYVRNFFPNFVRTDLPPGVYARTQSSAGWAEKSVDEKKTERLTILLSSAIFDTWIDYHDFRQPSHILGAVLTITILHRLAHIIRRVFCTTSTKSMPVLDPICQPIQEGNWAWERNILGEMQVAFEADAAGDWSKVPAVGFVIDNKTQWVHKSEIGVIGSIISLQLFALKQRFQYDGSDMPPFPAVVWRHGGVTEMEVPPPRNFLSFTYTSDKDVEWRLQDARGIKVEIMRPVCGTGMDLEM